MDELFDLLQHFALLVPPSSLQFPAGSFDVAHGFLLNHILLDPHLNAYPPSSEYRVVFWKWAVTHLEDLAKNKDVEIDSRIYDTLISLMDSSSSSKGFGLSRPPLSSFVTYYWDLNASGIVPSGYQKATFLESRTLVEQGTTGLKTWPAALALAGYLVATSEFVANKHVLELGSGTGFLGIIVATIQLHRSSDTLDNRYGLWLTDLNDEVLGRCQDNLRLPCNSSASHPNINCRSLDWTAALCVGERPSVQSLLDEIDADVVLGADIVYDPSIIPSLVAVLRLALDPRPGKGSRFAILALTVRNRATYTQFLKAIEPFFVKTELDSSKTGSLFLYKHCQEQHTIQLLQLQVK